ncbi:MAG: hypothetical protein N3A69_02770 [Leptospiraceae bacterium]|nr:hypothetical protein [Leptospiraceae bacterium]
MKEYCYILHGLFLKLLPKTVVFLLIPLLLSCFLKNTKETLVDEAIDESVRNLREQILKNYTIKQKKQLPLLLLPEQI